MSPHADDVHVRSLEAELERTHQVLEGLARDSAARDNECFSPDVDDVLAQLSELAAIGVERRALRQDAEALAAQLGFLREQMDEMSRRLTVLRQRWSTREISSAVQREICPEPAPSMSLEFAAVL